MRNILSGALALSALFAAPAFAAEQVVRLEVGGLTCPSCSFIVGSSLKSGESVVIGVFAAGEMLDWEAPTGGYLLTACLDTGRLAGREAAAWAVRRH